MVSHCNDMLSNVHGTLMCLLQSALLAVLTRAAVSFTWFLACNASISMLFSMQLGPAMCEQQTLTEPAMCGNTVLCLLAAFCHSSWSNLIFKSGFCITDSDRQKALHSLCTA